MSDISTMHDACLAVIKGATLSEEETQRVFKELMSGESDPIQTAGLLSVMAHRGETVEEIAGAARVMRERCTPIRESGLGLLDTCGTGGDGLGTFNISTAAAILCAATDVKVAKHGNRSVSSKTGSADVLEELGVSLNMTPEQVDACIEQVGIGFCFAPLLHAAMKHVVPVRKALKARTIFNFLGPLTNPAHAEFQLLGTIRTSWAEKLAHAAAKLGTTRTAIVCGNDELDEVSLWGKTAVFLVEGNQVQSLEWTAADFGLSECRVEDLVVENASESANCIRAILYGERGPARDICVANAAAALWTTGKATDLKSAVAQIEKGIDSGAAKKLAEELAQFTQAQS